MDFSITTDKNQYFAGDKVIASFYVDGTPHKNTKNLVLSLKSGENVGVEVTDSDGDSSIYWKRTVYAENMISIPITEVIFPFTHTLEYQLPEFTSENMADHNFEVYHRAEIKLDIARRSDKRYFENIPLVAASSVYPSRIEVQDEDISVQVDGIQPHPGETIRTSINNNSNNKFRSYRIELRQTLIKKAGPHISKKKYIELLEKMDPLLSVSSDVKLPEMILSSITGENFEIITELQFVFDRFMKRDLNISIPFEYFRKRTGVNCENCSFFNTSDAIFCMECGTRLKKNSMISMKNQYIQNRYTVINY